MVLAKEHAFKSGSNGAFNRILKKILCRNTKKLISKLLFLDYLQFFEYFFNGLQFYFKGLPV